MKSRRENLGKVGLGILGSGVGLGGSPLIDPLSVACPFLSPPLELRSLATSSLCTPLPQASTLSGTSRASPSLLLDFFLLFAIFSGLFFFFAFFPWSPISFINVGVLFSK